ncbi:capsular exopolysaccharide synthesis family protein [Krasilnikovia cinnamomea]|uniref:non-specific protein-tyrosine kinase n=1 Tax=Krasilnikovia cinnamomea TaxID=349313 RepID=A0A4Q7ZH86_9ACTN|nr:polysaccharide biosynthesis tyrosine autokinase [Krasilnikovia cinnamomea]RZU50148.1 capsular exopolysaccharide synthesis family protein [Krasilnikovia cinnamomea]
MDLRDYLRAIRKRWWLVVGTTTVAVGVAITITLLTPPKYAASASFFVSTRGTAVSDAYQGGLFSQQRVKSYVDVLTSNRLAQSIVATGQTDLSAEAVQSEITAQVVPDTVLVRATVTDENRARALQLAQILSVQFPLLIEKLETPPGAKVATVGVKVIAEPKLADAPVSPQPVRNVGLGIVVGLLIGIGFAALRESLDSTIRSPEALNKATSAPVLSAIPFDGKAEKSPLITEGSAQSTRAEALRQLRTNLQFVNVDRPLRSLVVSSALPGEGKSSTVCNLGIAFAEAGKRVLLIDADLRRPRLAQYLDLEGAVGLTNVLAGQANVRDVVQSWGGSGLWVLPSGYVPPNPSELLGSGNMADLLTSLGSAFDVVIIDTPPLLPVTDAAVMATLADGCILVSRHAKTTTAQAGSAAGALTAVGARLLGCVLNMTPRKGGGTYAYYSYGPSEEDLAPAVPLHAPVIPAKRNLGKLPAPPKPLEAAPAMGRAPARPARHSRSGADAPTTEIRLPHTHQPSTGREGGLMSMSTLRIRR